MKRKNEIPRESAKLHGMTNNHQNDSDPLRNIDPVNTLCLSVCLSKLYAARIYVSNTQFYFPRIFCASFKADFIVSCMS